MKSSYLLSIERFWQDHPEHKAGFAIIDGIPWAVTTDTPEGAAALDAFDAWLKVQAQRQSDEGEAGERAQGESER